MKLSQKECDILACIHLQGDVSISKIAQELQYRPHAVRHCVKSLTERGVLSSFTLVNPYALGLHEYVMYFSLGRRGNPQHFLRALMDSETVSLVFELGGDYTHSISIFEPDPWRVNEVLKDLSDQHDVELSNKLFLNYYSVTYFQPRYLSTKAIVTRPLETARPKTLAEIDEIDHRILSAIVESPTVNNLQLARTIDLPKSTTDYRLQRLRDSHVYSGVVFTFNPSVVGIQVYWLLVSFLDFGTQTTRRIYSFCAKHPHVTCIVCCLGSWDYEICVEVWDVRQLTKIQDELSAALGAKLTYVRVVPHINELKFKLYPFKQVPWFTKKGRATVVKRTGKGSAY